VTQSRWTEPILYFLVGVVSLGMAIWVTSHWAQKSHSQEPPAVEENIAAEAVAEEVVPEEAVTEEVVTEEDGVLVTDEGQAEADRGEPAEGAPVKTGLLEDFPYLQPYKYDAENRRDPFRSFSFKGGDNIDPGATVFPILPLQRYDLDELKLIGIMWDVRVPKAMFLDPNKEVHTLGKDDRIGRNNGYIAVIREGEVVIVEAQKIREELVYTSRVLKMDR